MKLKKDFVVHNAANETVIVPTGKADFTGMIRGNKTFGAIMELLKEETTEDEIIAAMKKRFDAPEDMIRRDVEKAVSELRKIGAIDG